MARPASSTVMTACYEPVQKSRFTRLRSRLLAIEDNVSGMMFYSAIRSDARKMTDETLSVDALNLTFKASL